LKHIHKDTHAHTHISHLLFCFFFNDRLEQLIKRKKECRQYTEKKKCSGIKKRIEIDYICRTKKLIKIYMEKIRDADDEKKNYIDLYTVRNMNITETDFYKRKTDRYYKQKFLPFFDYCKDGELSSIFPFSSCTSSSSSSCSISLSSSLRFANISSSSETSDDDDEDLAIRTRLRAGRKS